jgi:hypothetical protein
MAQVLRSEGFKALVTFLVTWATQRSRVRSVIGREQWKLRLRARAQRLISQLGT